MTSGTSLKHIVLSRTESWSPRARRDVGRTRRESASARRRAPRCAGPRTSPQRLAGEPKLKKRHVDAARADAALHGELAVRRLDQRPAPRHDAIDAEPVERDGVHLPVTSSPSRNTVTSTVGCCAARSDLAERVHELRRRCRAGCRPSGRTPPPASPRPSSPRSSTSRSLGIVRLVLLHPALGQIHLARRRERHLRPLDLDRAQLLARCAACSIMSTITSDWMPMFTCVRSRPD